MIKACNVKSAESLSLVECSGCSPGFASYFGSRRVSPRTSPALGCYFSVGNDSIPRSCEAIKGRACGPLSTDPGTRYAQ